MPAAALRGARLDKGIAGKVLPEGGLLVITWGHGDKADRLRFPLRPRGRAPGLGRRPSPHRAPPTTTERKAHDDDLHRGAAKVPAVLVLEDGRTFRGRAYGAVGETFGEAVFSTGMTGYQETLTDPSYHRQVVVMTAPHIGNTGVNDEDPESGRIWVSGYVVRDPARIPSNWRSGPLAGRGARHPGRRRHQRHRHPRADPPPPRARRDAGRHLLRRRAARRRARCWPRCARPPR